MFWSMGMSLPDSLPGYVGMPTYPGRESGANASSRIRNFLEVCCAHCDLSQLLRNNY